MNTRHAQSLLKIFRWPVLIGALSLTGLLAALLADDWVDWLGTAMVAVPLVILLWVWRGQSTG